MTNTVTHVEIAKIENDARRLRAAAMRDMVHGLGAWLRGLFGGQHAAGAHRA
ncbi:hypothetical protein P2H44_15945 [Albimonas sp. CAU 1670]|uniref:RSP_7527 family protein n=1 Tax=Albimonas sp. CAU 1670 TaxID=3032599 RepID=UPI0023DAD506|nr:hypothetical protein [Albimonas sp. CAU 1670]MDF2234053.1 hypothetical protein [Albimonas sp. CAU 1670]